MMYIHKVREQRAWCSVEHTRLASIGDHLISNAVGIHVLVLTLCMIANKYKNRYG